VSFQRLIAEWGYSGKKKKRMRDEQSRFSNEKDDKSPRTILRSTILMPAGDPGEGKTTEKAALFSNY
jgi:hypothetical protein